MRKRTTTTMARVTPRGAVCELDRVGVEQDETSEAVGEGRVVFGTSEGTGKCSLPTQGSDCIGRFRTPRVPTLYERRHGSPGLSG